MERLVADSHESKQRCVAEIISGLIRGSKHWSYSKVCVRLTFRREMELERSLDMTEVRSLHVQLLCHKKKTCLFQVEGLWALLCPLLRTALSNITVETYADWGTCIATACVSFFFF